MGFDTMTPERLREISKAASAKGLAARRQRADIRKMLKANIEYAISYGSLPKLDNCGNPLKDEYGNTPTIAEYLIAQEYEKAMSGDPEARERVFGWLGMNISPEAQARSEKFIIERESEAAEDSSATANRLIHISQFLDESIAKGGYSFLYGTTRSGKTYGIIQWLLESLSNGTLSGNSLVAGQTMPFLSNGACAYIRELAPKFGNLQVLNDGREVRVRGEKARLYVQSFEKPERALSAQWEVLFCNEGNTLSKELTDQLKTRTSRLLIVDFNPSVGEWWGKELMTPDNSLFCTFKDNPYLSDNQMATLEEVRVRGEKAPAGSYDRWFYEVYYLGQFSEVGGGVFRQVFRQPLTEWEEQTKNLLHVWGIDFGDTTDPNALVEVAVDKDAKTLYIRCLFYETATDDLRLAEILVSNNVDRLIFETATGGNTRALNLRRLGFKGWLAPAEKERVSASVFNLSTWRINCADDTTYSEFSGYRLEEGKFKGADHCIDAVRYAAHLIITNRIKS